MASNDGVADVVDDDVSRYAHWVLAGGTTRAGPLVRAACQRHLDDLRVGHKRGLVWRFDKAQEVYDFFSGALTLTEGEHSAKPFTLAPSQKFILGCIFGWYRKDGHRRFRVAYIEEGKGNGKSPLAAGIGLYMLVADGESGAEIYAAATTRDQARILFRDAENMVAANRALKRRLGLTINNIAYHKTSSFFRAISSEGRQLDGKRVHCALLDEIHEHPNDVVVGKMRAGTKGRRQALIFMITNSGWNTETVCYHWHEYSRKIVKGVIRNDAVFGYVCGLDEGDDYRDEKVWIKANPLLGVSITKKYLREQVDEARGMPSAESLIRRLNFCEWTQSLGHLFDLDLWASCSGYDKPEPDLAGRLCYGGLDLSSKNDLSALQLAFPMDDGSIELRAWYWAAEQDLLERTIREGVPWDVWQKEGYLLTTPGPVIDYSFIAEQVGKIAAMYDIKAIGYDRFRIEDFKRECGDIGVAVKLVEHGQGYKDMSPAIEVMEDGIKKRLVVHRSNPITTYCVSCAYAKTDPAKNRKIVKAQAIAKIDGAVAAAMALRMVQMEAVKKSIYETRGLTTL